MSGRKHKTPRQRVEIAREVQTGRDNGVPWKVLERVYGCSRWQLRRYTAAAPVSEMHHQSSKCTILEASGAG